MSYNDILETQTTYTDTRPHTVVENVRYLNKQLEQVIELLKGNVLLKKRLVLKDNVNTITVDILTNDDFTTLTYDELLKYINNGLICYVDDIESGNGLHYISEIDEDNGLYICKYDGTAALSAFKPTIIIVS